MSSKSQTRSTWACPQSFQAKSGNLQRRPAKVAFSGEKDYMTPLLSLTFLPTCQWTFETELFF